MRKYPLLLSLLAASFVPFAHAEDWAYTADYPYVWTPTQQSWLYIPDTPQMVWDYSAEDWALNPLNSEAFDIRERFSVSDLSLSLRFYLAPGEATYAGPLLLSFHNTPESTGAFSMVEVIDEPVDASVYYQLEVDSARAHILVTWQDGTEGARSYSIELKFDTLSSGEFFMTGFLYPGSSEPVFEHGTFGLMGPEAE